MTELIWIAAIAGITTVIVARCKYALPPLNYYARRTMSDGELAHVREASGPNPQVVMEMLLMGKHTFKKDDNDVVPT